MVLMKCSEVSKRVSDIIDEEADLYTRFRFYLHIMMCSTCRRYFNQFKTVKEIAGEVSPTELPEDFDRVMDFVMYKIKSEDNKKDG